MTTTSERPRRESKRRAARYANIDPRILEGLIDQGLLTVYRAGQKVFRIDLDELDYVMAHYGEQERVTP